MAAGNKHQFEGMFLLAEDVVELIRVDVDRHRHVVLEQQVVLLRLHPVPAEMQDLDTLLDPVVQFVDGGGFTDVVDHALPILQYLFYRAFLLEVVYLLLDLAPLHVDQRLAVHEQKGRHLLLLGLLHLSHLLQVLRKHETQRVLGIAMAER